MVEWMISSSVLIVLVTAMRYFFRGKLPMRAWYGLWLVVALRLLVPVSFSSAGSVGSGTFCILQTWFSISICPGVAVGWTTRKPC